jgi:mono/diheme cytochrome c family protein
MHNISFRKGKIKMSHRNKSILYSTILFVLLLTACGGGNGDGTTEGADAGKTLFEQSILEGQPGCVTCHSREPGVVLVGPSLATIGREAEGRVAGQSGEEYVRQSILEPDAYVVSGYPAGTMPKVWVDVLSDEQVDQLVAYLQTLK